MSRFNEIPRNGHFDQNKSAFRAAYKKKQPPKIDIVRLHTRNSRLHSSTQVWQDVEAVKKALAPAATRSVARVAGRRRHRPRTVPPPPIADCPRTDADAREEEAGIHLLTNSARINKKNNLPLQEYSFPMRPVSRYSITA